MFYFPIHLRTNLVLSVEYMQIDQKTWEENRKIKGVVIKELEIKLGSIKPNTIKGKIINLSFVLNGVVSVVGKLCCAE